MAKLVFAAIVGGLGYIYLTKGGINAIMNPLVLGTVFVAFIIMALVKDA